jgi:hypothetical protein
MKTAVFWVVRQCSLEIVRRFGGIYHLHVYGQRVSEARTKETATMRTKCLGFSFPVLHASKC